MVGYFSNIRIRGISTNDEQLEDIKTSTSCINAAKKLINHLKWDVNDIKVMIIVTETSDFKFPSTAFYIQKHLEMDMDCVVYDINLGATGYMVGIQLIAGLLQGFGENAKGLLLAGNMDKGSATAIQVEPESLFLYNQRSYGELYSNIFKYEKEDEVTVFIDEVVEKLTHSLSIVRSEVIQELTPSLVENIDWYIDSRIGAEYISDMYSEFIPFEIIKKGMVKDKEKISVLATCASAGISVGCTYLEIDRGGILF